MTVASAPRPTFRRPIADETPAIPVELRKDIQKPKNPPENLTEAERDREYQLYLRKSISEDLEEGQLYDAASSLRYVKPTKQDMPWLKKTFTRLLSDMDFDARNKLTYGADLTQRTLDALTGIELTDTQRQTIAADAMKELAKSAAKVDMASYSDPEKKIGARYWKIDRINDAIKIQDPKVLADLNHNIKATTSGHYFCDIEGVKRSASRLVHIFDMDYTDSERRAYRTQEVERKLSGFYGQNYKGRDGALRDAISEMRNRNLSPTDRMKDAALGFVSEQISKKQVIDDLTEVFQLDPAKVHKIIVDDLRKYSTEGRVKSKRDRANYVSKMAKLHSLSWSELSGHNVALDSIATIGQKAGIRDAGEFLVSNIDFVTLAFETSDIPVFTGSGPLRAAIALGEDIVQLERSQRMDGERALSFDQAMGYAEGFSQRYESKSAMEFFKYLHPKTPDQVERVKVVAVEVLNRARAYTKGEDGYYDPATVEAVKALDIPDRAKAEISAEVIRYHIGLAADTDSENDNRYSSTQSSNEVGMGEDFTKASEMQNQISIMGEPDLLAQVQTDIRNLVRRFSPSLDSVEQEFYNLQTKFRPIQAWDSEDDSDYITGDDVAQGVQATVYRKLGQFTQNPRESYYKVEQARSLLSDYSVVPTAEIKEKAIDVAGLVFEDPGRLEQIQVSFGLSEDDRKTIVKRGIILNAAERSSNIGGRGESPLDYCRKNMAAHGLNWADLAGVSTAVDGAISLGVEISHAKNNDELDAFFSSNQRFLALAFSKPDEPILMGPSDLKDMNHWSLRLDEAEKLKRAGSLPDEDAKGAEVVFALEKNCLEWRENNQSVSEPFHRWASVFGERAMLGFMVGAASRDQGLTPFKEHAVKLEQAFESADETRRDGLIQLVGSIMGNRDMRVYDKRDILESVLDNVASLDKVTGPESADDYIQRYVRYSSQFAPIIRSASRSSLQQQFRMINFNQQMSNVYGRDPQELDTLISMFSAAGTDPLHLMGSIMCVKPSMDSDVSLLETAQVCTKILAETTGNPLNLAFGGLSHFSSKGAIHDIETLTAYGGALASLTPVNASAQVWAIARKVLPPAYSGENDMPVSDIGSEVQILRSYLSDFGTSDNLRFYTLYRRLKNGGIPSADAQKGGITETGDEGIKQMKKIQAELRSGLFVDDRNLRITSDIQADIIAPQLNYTENIHSRGEPLVQLSQRLCDDIARGDVAEVPPEYERGTISVEKKDAKAMDEFEFIADAHQQVASIRQDLRLISSKSMGEVLNEAIAEVESGAKRESKNLTAAISELDGGDNTNKGRIMGLTQKKKRYDQLLDGMSGDKRPGDVQEFVEKIASWEGKKDDPVTTPALMNVLMRHGLTQLSDDGAAFRESIEAPLKESIYGVTHFFETSLKVQVLGSEEGDPGHIKLSKAARKRAQMVVGQPLLSQERQRFDNIESSGVEEWTMMPSRGLLGETSGYICLACWTREKDIMKRYPNIVPIVFGKSLDTPDEKLIGATIVIEGRTKEKPDRGVKSEKVLIVRGFNPLETTIRQVNAGSALERFLDYLEPIARKRGATKIMIAKSASGVSMTNREPIADYVNINNPVYANAPIVELADDPPTKFNEYPIERSCIVVRDLSLDISPSA